ncbi:MAG TPA: hypothetical protein PLV68_06515, partial [Ilumatobacteraceae bacterium]|nr:hypothetical protein [Ilumatobacteraceae bacterium]
TVTDSTEPNDAHDVAAPASPASGAVAAGATASEITGAPAGRDPYVDFLRAFSLLVVVAWHWVFTIIIWRDDGPHATNPIGF